MLGRLLKRHSNYNEYWVCAVCGRPRRRNTSRSKPCKFCRADEPPRIRITEKKGKGDTSGETVDGIPGVVVYNFSDRKRVEAILKEAVGAGFEGIDYEKLETAYVKWIRNL